MDPNLIQQHPLMAILAALISGGGLSLLANRFWLTRKEETDVATALRDEMRKQLADFNTRLSNMQTELDGWRTKYFTLLEEHTELKLENRRLRAELDLINPKPAFYNNAPRPMLYRLNLATFTPTATS